jgi:hypothetical protein
MWSGCRSDCAGYLLQKRTDGFQAMFIAIGAAYRRASHHPVHSEIGANRPWASVLLPPTKKAAEQSFVVSQPSAVIAAEMWVALRSYLL